MITITVTAVHLAKAKAICNSRQLMAPDFDWAQHCPIAQACNDIPELKGSIVTVAGINTPDGKYYTLPEPARLMSIKSIWPGDNWWDSHPCLQPLTFTVDLTHDNQHNPKPQSV